MKPVCKPALIVLSLFFLFSATCLGQFEQKLTMQFSGGISSIISDYENEDFFDTGPMFNGGIQYNFNRQFSISGLVMYGMYFSVHDQIKDATFFNLGVGASAKYKLVAHSAVKPYLLMGFSACFVKQEYNLAGRTYTKEQPITPGLVTGLGIETDLSDNFTLFIQGGFNKLIPPGSSDIPPVESVYGIIGFNINMFKSKTL